MITYPELCLKLSKTVFLLHTHSQTNSLEEYGSHGIAFLTKLVIPYCRASGELRVIIVCMLCEETISTIALHIKSPCE